jgi:hypothetical protein
MNTQLDDFRKPMQRKYKMTNFIYNPSKPTSDPCVFFGYYANGELMKMLRQRTGLIVIVWAGSDSMRLHKTYGALEYFHKHKDRVFHIAYSHWIKADLDAVGLPYFEIPVFPVTFEQFKVEPLGDFVYHYTSSLGSHQWFYGTDTVQDIQKRIGNNHVLANKFIITNYHAVKRDKVHLEYRKAFVGVRLTSHDNMALTCVEMALMGRRSIFNGNIPGAIHYEDRSEVYNLLIEEYQYNEPDKLVAEEMLEVINIDKGQWLDTKFYE